MRLNQITLVYISATFSILPLVTSLTAVRQIKREAVPIFILVVLSVVFEAVGVLSLKSLEVRNNIFYIYTIFEFVLLSCFYIVFFRPHFRPYLLYAAIPVFLAGSLLARFILGAMRADYFSVQAEGFVFVCSCLYFFYFILKNLLFDNLLNEPSFWINTGVLFYFGGNLCIFMFMSYLANQNTKEYALLWSSIHTFFNILMNVFFSIGFWKLRTK